MSSGPTIHYCRRQDIDIARWDACVARSASRLIYGFHFYLDHMTAGDWDGLVLEDYQAVMPLTWRRKYGVAYLAQPAFTQQTGIFSPHPLPQSLTLAFLQETGRHYRFADLFLNYGNPFPHLPAVHNYVLPLDKPYETLQAGYKENHRRNLRQSGNHGLHYTSGIPLAEALGAYRTLYGHRNLRTMGDEEYRRFGQLCADLQKEQRLILRAVINRQQQRLAMAVILRDDARLFLLQSTALPAGRDIGANHFLIDQLIREFAGQPLILDFEGSEDPGIARFYAGFGSADQPYFFCRLNNLPWPFRLLKAPSSIALQPKKDRPAALS